MPVEKNSRVAKFEDDSVVVTNFYKAIAMVKIKVWNWMENALT